MDQATREIMWNIPPAYKYVMYSLFAVSMLLFIKGFFDKFQLILKGDKVRGKDGLIPDSFLDLNWMNFFKTILLQGKIPREKSVAKFHAPIYYGFIILWIATDLVAIHYDTPFKVFQGTTYIIISFLADIAGLAIILGILMAYKRRYINRPDYLSATKPKSELYMYGMLLNLVVVGFLIEGIRILGTDVATNSMVNEKLWAPIGWLIAVGIQKSGASEVFLSSTYRFLWAFHMCSTMVFIASIPFTKFSHIILAPLSALFTRQRRGGVLNPMNFEDENIETFGLGKISEMSAKQRFDTQVCVECGRCTNSCPANLAGKILDPKLIVTKMRDFWGDQTKQGKVDGSFWEGDVESPLYKANELDACTMCGACMEECPVNIEHVQMISDLRRYKVLTLGEIPPAAADAVNKIRNNGNPWGIAQEDRFQWADGLDVPIAQEKTPIDYLYYVGCAGSYDASNQKVVRDTIQLLQKANVNFAVIGKSEKCNGDPIRRFGDEYTFSEVAIEQIDQLNKYDFKQVVTHCPHCLHTIDKEYEKFEGGQYDVVHHTELLAQLVENGKLKPEKELKEERTYHDPCYLGRHHGQYSAPRSILESIPGISIKEMERSKDKSLCCGMGGGNMWYELPEGEHLAHNRLKDVAQTKVEHLSTACSFCMINFKSAKDHDGSTENVQIEDIASTLSRSIL